MSTNVWFKASPFGSISVANHSANPKSLKIRAAFFDFPLGSKILVRNLSYSTNESTIKKEFSHYGQVSEVELIKDKKTMMSKGYAFIQYTSQDDAIDVLESMDKRYLDGRVIFVEIAKPRNKPFGVYPKTSGPPEEQHFPAPKLAKH